MLDKDGGGSINHHELYELMKDLNIGITVDEIKMVLADLDHDGTGEIDFDEFLYAVAAPAKEEADDQTPG